MWKEKRPSSGCCGAAKAKLLPKKRPARSHAQAMHSMPLDLSDQSQVLLTQSVSSLRQGKVTNQAWVVPVKSRGDKDRSGNKFHHGLEGSIQNSSLRCRS